jgi:cyclic pyranopterin phosphate synthase
MQTEEILQLAKTFIELGTNKIRLTGGEPLVRKDAAAIIKNLSAYPIRLSLTTNGVRIHEFIDVFLEANIKSINVSLDTLQEDKFQLITRRNNFKRIRDNIDLLLNNNIHVKVNVVVMKGINDSELTDFIAWTKDSPVHVRFIEFMPFSGNRWMSDKVFTWQNMLESIETKYDFIKLKDETHDTTKKYIVSGHAGTFSVISTMTAPFCSSCNRMRLTADGKMKNCLFSKDETDLLTALRNGRNIKELILQNIYGKAAQRGGQFTENFQELQTDEIHNRSMIGIGG